MTTALKYHPFDPNPRPPKHSLPKSACDSQFHVLGDKLTYPTRPGAVYEMPTATVQKVLHMHRTLGIERGIIVQPTTYGADHQVTLDGLKVAGSGYRACANASVFQEKGDAYIARLDEAGVKGFNMDTWAGLVAPAGTPPEVIKKLNAALRPIIDSPDVQAKFKNVGFEGFSSTPEELGDYIKVQLAEWQKMIKDAGIQSD